MISNKLLFVVILCASLSCTTPKEQEPTLHWYKGNLHTHSYWSDGDDYPEMIMDWYKSHGYHFVVLSDHNILAKGEKWKTIPKSPTHEMAFDKYLKKYGDKWVNYREDSAGRIAVKLKTLEEYRPLFEEEGEFLIIQSEEISDSYDSKPLHMNVTNIQEKIDPQGGTSVADVLQRNLDQVIAQRKQTGVPMFMHINHPNFVWAITPEDIIQLDGERFFEVYNGHPLVHNYGDSLRPGMEALWDQVQTAYLLDQKPSLYGLAVDDAHNYHVFNENSSNPGRGWVMVHAASLDPAALINAMEKGAFYSSTGVTLEEVDFDGVRLQVKVKAEKGVKYSIRFFGTKKSEPSASGILLKEVAGKAATYQLTGEELYVRAKVVSSKNKTNPYKPGDKEVAWTQPVTPER